MTHSLHENVVSPGTPVRSDASESENAVHIETDRPQDVGTGCAKEGG